MHNRNKEGVERGDGRPRVPAVPASRGRQVGVLCAAVILCVRGVTSQWSAGCPGRTRRRSDRIIERRGSEAAGAAHASDAEYARACHGTRARTDWHQLCAADCVTTPRRSWHAVTDSPRARACVLCRGQAFPRVCASCSRTRLRSVPVKRRYCYATRACHQQRVRACTLHPAPCSSGASNSTAPVGCLKLSAACRVMFALRAQARPTPAQALDFRSEMTRLEAMSCDACKYCRLYSWHAALSLN